MGLAIADVSDKGVPAALFMMSSRTLLKGAAIGLDEPGKVLAEVNDLLNEDNEAEMFVTMLYATYDTKTGQAYVCERRAQHARSVPLRTARPPNSH